MKTAQKQYGRCLGAMCVPALILGALATQLQAAPQTCVPELLGSYDTPGVARSVDVVGTTAYVADYASGLQILDVSDPTLPVLLGSYDVLGNAYEVTVQGTTAYVAARGTGGLQIIDVSNPAAPTLLGWYDTPSTADGVEVVGTTAYVADRATGLLIIDVSSPATPTLLGTYDTPGSAWRVVVVGTVAYVGDAGSGLQIIDVSSPSTPTLLGSYDTPGSAKGTVVVGTTAYVADGQGGGLQIIDVSNPAAPTLIGWYDTPVQAFEVAVVGTTAYVVDNWPDGRLEIIDVSSPAAPTLLGFYDTPDSAQGLALVGDTAYVADQLSGLQIVDVGECQDSVASRPFCDGSDGSLATCPCGNTGGPDTGCDIQQGTGGVGLAVVAQQTTPDNRATLTGTGFNPVGLATAVVVRGTSLETTPIVFGDGLRCVATPLVRLAAVKSEAGASLHTFGHGVAAGTYYYQLWFRNQPAMFCTPEAFNLSSGRTLVW